MSTTIDPAVPEVSVPAAASGGDPGPGCCPGSSRPPTRSTSATTSGRCGSGWTCSRTTSRSSSSPTMHAITVEQDPKVLRERCLRAAAQLLAMGVDPDRSRDLRPEPDPRARPARLGAAVPDRLRRGPADDAVQGQVRQGRRGRGQRRPVHLPDPPGGRHPALPAALRAGRRGPAPAPRADPRPRPAVQPPLQEDLPAARALHPQGHREDHRPAGRRPRRCRSRRRRRPGSSRCSTTRG